METPILIRLVLGVALLAGNGFFVATEFALTRVRQFDREDFEGHHGLETAWEMTHRLEVYLTSCQVGITITSIGLGIAAEPAVAELFRRFGIRFLTASTLSHSVSVASAIVVINLFHVVLAEQVPTYLGVERAQFIARYFAPIHYIWSYLMYPIIIGADWLAKKILSLFGVEITRSWTGEELEEEITSFGELRRRMGDVLSQGGVSGERRDEVLGALDIEKQSISEIMVPADRVLCLDVNKSWEEKRAIVRANAYVRFPLVDGSINQPVGVVYTPALVRQYEALNSGDVRLRDLALEPLEIPAEEDVSDAIDIMQEENQEMAFVVSNEGVQGVLTITDAFEAIMGEMEDPYD